MCGGLGVGSGWGVCGGLGVGSGWGVCGGLCVCGGDQRRLWSSTPHLSYLHCCALNLYGRQSSRTRP